MNEEIRELLKRRDPDSIKRVNEILAKEREEVSKREIIKPIIEDIIHTIEKELDNSIYPDTYICEDGSTIHADTCDIESWFGAYQNILRRKYIGE